MTAKIGDTSVKLTLEGGGVYWTGELPLTSVPEGTPVLDVVATDQAGGTGMGSVSFRYDRPPVITVRAPRSFTVGTPLLHLDASCADTLDSGACASFSASIVTRGSGSKAQVVATGTASITTDVDLSTWLGQELDLSFTASDSAGPPNPQGGNEEMLKLPVAADASAALVRVAEVDGKVFDFDDQKILSADHAFATRTITVDTGWRWWIGRPVRRRPSRTCAPGTIRI